MGKSTAVAMLRRLGLPVDDADAAVHRLLATDRRLIGDIAAAFPGTVTDGAVDRRQLGQMIFANPHDAAPRRALEAMVHPRVAQARQGFIDRHRRAGAGLVVLDIPLLFETHTDAVADAVLVVTAPAFLQRQRVLRRPGMTEARFDAIQAAQMPDREKRRRADYLVFTGLSKHYTLRCLQRVIASIRASDGSQLHRSQRGVHARSRPRH